MDFETIPLSQLPAGLETTLRECADGGRVLVVQLPDQRRVAMQPLDGADADDDLTNELIETDRAFRTSLERSTASGSKPLNLDPEAW